VIEILRAVDRVSIPWKNGFGRTAILAVAEAQGSFHWRLSIADEIANAPFSPFPGVDRHLTPLPGPAEHKAPGGFGLRRNGETVHVAERDVVSFPGEEPIASGGDADGHTALNLMVRRGSHVGTLHWRELGDEPVDITTRADRILLVVSGTVRLTPGGTSAGSVRLGPLDAVHLSVGSATIVGPAVVIVCTITPIDIVA
jgi:environmental stress-induced protein Ves